MMIAITRKISPAFASCELTHIPRMPIDVARAEVQHQAYADALRAYGCRILSLPAEEALPDSVFVEDAALVLDEIAVITRPGAATRRLETESIAATLEPFRPLTFISAPGTLDGGDVLKVGRTIYIGRSSRTNRAAFEQLHPILGEFEYNLIRVPVEGCLHLKSAVSQVGENTLLYNPAWVSPASFGQLELIPVHPAEPAGANALLVNGVVIFPSAYPRTLARLRDHTIDVRPVEVSEILKAEGGVTCCSLIFPAVPQT